MPITIPLSDVAAAWASEGEEVRTSSETSEALAGIEYQALSIAPCALRTHLARGDGHIGTEHAQPLGLLRPVVEYIVRALGLIDHLAVGVGVVDGNGEARESTDGLRGGAAHHGTIVFKAAAELE